MTYVQRPGGVGGYKLHLHPNAVAVISLAVVLALGENLGDHRLQTFAGQSQVAIQLVRQ